MNEYQTWTDYTAVDRERAVRTAAADKDIFFQVHVVTGGENAVYTLAEHDTLTGSILRYVRKGE